MRGQLSIDFLIAVSVLIIIARILIVFFLPFTTPNYTQITINNVCNYISNAISYTASTTANSSFTYIPLIERYDKGSLNISIAGNTVIVRSDNYVIPCSTISNSSAKENFLTSNLWIYKLPNGEVYTAYFYQKGNGVNGTFLGGGFYPSASVYMEYSNGTAVEVANSLTSPFTYNAGSLISTLKPGEYSFYAEDTDYPQVKVAFPLLIP
ncbi:MAG: hypothetical protein ACP5MT_02425 [Candidatus Acidifodinimicrobium sp.]